MQKLLEKLITFQSDKNHPEETKRCVEFVAADLKKSGLQVKIYQVEGASCLVAAKTLKKHYQYILNGHLDVVPASYKDAFKPKVKGKRLYGRGASDMKGTLAVMIEIVKKLKNTDVALMLTTDEEEGGKSVEYLVEKEKYYGDCVVVPDGGDNWTLVVAQKGALHLQITSQGRAAHAAYPWLGENAIEKLIGSWQTIKKEFPSTTAKNRWLTTVNLSKLTGGDAVNKVPDKAQMYLDFRYPDKKQKDKILSLVGKICQKVKGISYQTKAEANVVTGNLKNPHLQKIIKICGREKINLRVSREHGASDARFFSQIGIPVVMFKPVSSQAHIDNEWIDLPSLQKFSQVLQKFLA